MKTWQRFILLILTMGVIGSVITFYHVNYEKEDKEIRY